MLKKAIHHVNRTVVVCFEIAGLLALLVFSFEVVRRVAPEEERIITLPPLAQPQRNARRW